MIQDFRDKIAKQLIDNTLDKCSRWAQHRIHTPNPHPGPLSFDKFPWQKEILDAEEPMVIVQKAAQMGYSVAGIIKALFKVEQEQEDVLYILPTAGLANDFAKGRIDQMVALSPPLQDMWLESNVGMKTTHKHAHVYIRGSVAESGLVSNPVGTAIVDEFDRCNIKAMALVLERLSAHEKKHFFGLSTPTLPNTGINEQFLLGTQEIFTFECPSCGKTIHLDWENSIEIIGESANDPRIHESYLKCSKCGGKLPHEHKTGPEGWLSTGKWEATHKAYNCRSFHMNQMYGPAITPGELVIAYLNGQASAAKQVEFVNQKLGMPFLMDGARITQKILDDCKESYQNGQLFPDSAGRNIFMGIDVGQFLDVAVVEFFYDQDPGYEPQIHRHAKVLWSGRLPGNDFEGLDYLMSQWQVQYACIDIDPERNSAKAFARRFHGYASVCQYRRGTTAHELKEAHDDDRVSILTLNRTAFLDLALGRFHKGKVSVPGNVPGVFEKHLQSLVRTYELDEMGQPKAVYQPLDDDHQAHALALAEAAHIRGYSKSTGRTIGPDESVHDF